MLPNALNATQAIIYIKDYVNRHAPASTTIKTLNALNSALTLLLRTSIVARPLAHWFHYLTTTLMEFVLRIVLASPLFSWTNAFPVMKDVRSVPPWKIA